VTPSVFGIVSLPPSEHSQRGLVLVAKALQNVANNVPFGSKEEYMEYLNSFINGNVAACQDYFDAMAKLRPTAKPALVSRKNSDLKDTSVKNMYKHLKSVFPKVETQFSNKAFFSKLKSLMTEIQSLETEHEGRKPLNAKGSRMSLGSKNSDLGEDQQLI